MKDNFTTFSHNQVMSVQFTNQPDQTETFCALCNDKIDSTKDYVVNTTFKGTFTYHKDCWTEMMTKHWKLVGEDHDVKNCGLCKEFINMNYGEPVTQNKRTVTTQGVCHECTFRQQLDIQAQMVCQQCGVEQWHTNELNCINKCINDKCPSNDLSKNRNWINGKRSPLIMLPDSYDTPVGYNRPVAKPKKCKDCKGKGCVHCSGRIVREILDEEQLGSEDIYAGFVNGEIETSFDSQHSMLQVFPGYESLIKSVVDDEVALSEDELEKIFQKKKDEELQMLAEGKMPKRKMRLLDIVYLRAIQQQNDRYDNLFYNKDPSKVFMKGRSFNVNLVSSFDPKREEEYKKERAQLLLNMKKKNMRLRERPPLDEDTRKFLQIAIRQMIQNGISISPDIPENIDIQVAKKITWNWFNDGKVGKDGKPRNAKKTIAVVEILKLQPRLNTADKIYVSKAFNIGTFQEESNRFFHFLQKDNPVAEESERNTVQMNEFYDFTEIVLPERMKRQQEMHQNVS